MELGDRRHQPGKVIDSWVYKVKDVELEQLEHVPEEERREGAPPKIARERVVNRIVNVEIRMEKTTVQSEEPPHPLDTVKLYAVCKELHIGIEGTDVELLRSVMWSMLDARFEIKWARYFLVKVDKQRVYSGTGTALAVSYDDIYRGVTHDGKLLMKIWKHGSTYKIEKWPGEFKQADGNVLACILATQANEDALREFVRRTDLLREKMQEFLRPDKIGTGVTVPGMEMG